MVPEPTIDITLRMPWPLICRLACQARIRRTTLDVLVDEALAAHLARRQA